MQRTLPSDDAVAAASRWCCHRKPTACHCCWRARDMSVKRNYMRTCERHRQPLESAAERDAAAVTELKWWFVCVARQLGGGNSVTPTRRTATAKFGERQRFNENQTYVPNAPSRNAPNYSVCPIIAPCTFCRCAKRSNVQARRNAVPAAAIYRPWCICSRKGAAYTTSDVH